jgi:hypothetical protein
MIYYNYYICVVFHRSALTNKYYSTGVKSLDMHSKSHSRHKLCFDFSNPFNVIYFARFY